MAPGKIDHAYYEVKFGLLHVACQGEILLELKIVPERAQEENRTAFTDRVACQVREYLDGKRMHFDIPYELRGTEFQKRVWHALERISYGETRTYGELARELGNKNANRAVGGACSRNPLWLVVPCHRVIGGSGSLTGYAGGLSMKRELLEIESTYKNKGVF